MANRLAVGTRAQALMRFKVNITGAPWRRGVVAYLALFILLEEVSTASGPVPQPKRIKVSEDRGLLVGWVQSECLVENSSASQGILPVVSGDRILLQPS
jgi:hypothetical protein